jgi:pyridoxal phosphate enzyme (YggS family)
MEPRAAEITRSVEGLLDTIPRGVTVVAAAKGRTAAEVEAVVRAGVTHVGHNYVQEARPIIDAVGERATWHMIGHLQRNKVGSAVRLFDLIETVDSARLARAIDRRCAALGRTMPVMIEVNSGREPAKAGVLPEQLERLVAEISELEHVRLVGLMTMGPRLGDPEDARPCFRATREAFERVARLQLRSVTMRYLSMGMSNSYRVAIEEGSNLVRIGTRIFGRSSEGPRTPGLARLSRRRDPAVADPPGANLDHTETGSR